MPDPSLPGIGHNNGPTMDEGHRWRTHAWARAKAQAAPRLPVEPIMMIRPPPRACMAGIAA